jgi:RimJ/RimL family protein N-acetyltransferase
MLDPCERLCSYRPFAGTVKAGEIHGPLVDVRPLRLRDAEAFTAVLRDENVTRMLPPRLRREIGEHYIRRALRSQRRGDGFAFAVVRAGTPEVIGHIALINWKRDNRQAEVGFWIRRRHWGKGNGTEALRLICLFGFESLRLHRIVATVVDGNDRSTRVLENAGFRLEGKRRQAARRHGQWADILEFGLLREEWHRAPSSSR